MKVLEISHMYPLFYDLNNGIAIHKQIKKIKDKGCEILVISPIPWTPFPVKYISNKWKLYSEVPTHKIIEDIEIFYPRYLVFPKAYFLASSGIRMYHGIKKIIEKLWHIFPFDIIHAHMALPDGYAGMLLSKDYNKPLIITFQATDLDITAKHNNNCLQSLKKVFMTADKIISPSPRLNKQLFDQFKIKSNTIVYGIDPKNIFIGDSNIKFKYKDNFILLSVSRLIKTKGIVLNIYALKELVKCYKRIIYLIVGDGPQGQYLKDLVLNLGLEKNVKFIGQLPNKNVMEYMSICDLFILPSWQETLGLVYLEAMAHGKPVVGVKGQGIDGIVEHKRNGMLVEPQDINSLVEVIAYLIDHSQEAKKMGERAKKLVFENYTWEENTEKTIKIYKEALNSDK